MAQPFIPVNGQAGLDQTANKLYVRNGGEKEIDKDLSTHTLTHTLTAVGFSSRIQ